MAHQWVIGKSGTGKSTYLLNYAREHITDTLIYLDPHGHDINTLTEYIPKKRRKDVILFDPTDTDFPIGWNILRTTHHPAAVASALVDTFKSVWGYTHLTTPTLDQYLFNTTFSLFTVPDSTLLGIKFMLTSKTYREKVMSFVRDPIVKDFWTNEFEPMTDKEKRETTLSTRNKIGMLLSDSRIRNVIGQSKSSFSVRDVLDRRLILLVRLPQGELGLEKTRLIGALFLAQFHAEVLAGNDNPCHVLIDEAHHFQSPSLIEMLSGVRKFNVNLVLANQYLAQFSREMLEAVLGNVEKKVAFRTGIEDSDFLAREFQVDNLERPLAELPTGTARVTNGTAGQRDMPTLPPPPFPQALPVIRRMSRNQYGRKREQVEAKIDRFIRSVT